MFLNCRNLYLLGRTFGACYQVHMVKPHIKNIHFRKGCFCLVSFLRLDSAANIKYQALFQRNLSDKFLPPYVQGEADIIELGKCDDKEDNVDADLVNELRKLSNEEKNEILKSVLARKRTSISSEDVDTIVEEANSHLNQHNFASYLDRLRDATSEAGICYQYLYQRKEFKLLMKKFNGLYYHMSGTELLSLLFLYRKVIVKEDLYVKHLLQIMKIHLIDLNSKDLLILEGILKKMESLLARNILFCLPLLMDKCLVSLYDLSEIPFYDLVAIFRICVQNHLKSTHLVLNEIGHRGVTSPKNALSILWIIFNLPSYPISRIIVPPSSEVVLETLTKECLTLMSRNIEDYTPDKLSIIVVKAAGYFEKGNDFVYHELFLQEVVHSAITNDWDLLKLNSLIYSLLRMQFVSEDLLEYFIAGLSSKLDALDGSKMLHVFSALSCLSTLPPKTYEVLDHVLSLISHRLTVDSPRRYLLIKKCVEAASIGFFSRTLFEDLFNEDYIKKYFSSSHSNLELDLFQVLLMNYWLGHNEPYSDLCLKPELKDWLFQKYSSLTPRSAGSLPALRSLCASPSFIISHVHCNKDLFIDHLLVVDEQGQPVKYNIESESDSHYTSYDDLDIDESYRKIAFVKIQNSWIFKPDRKFYGLARLLMDSLKISGFHVIPFSSDQSIEEQDIQIKHKLSEIGVEL